MGPIYTYSLGSGTGYGIGTLLISKINPYHHEEGKSSRRC